MISRAILAILPRFRAQPSCLTPPHPHLVPPPYARIAHAAFRQYATPSAPANPLAFRGKLLWLLKEEPAWFAAVTRAVVEARSEVRAKSKPHQSATIAEHTNIVQVKLWQDKSHMGKNEKRHAMHVFEDGKWVGDWK